METEALFTPTHVVREQEDLGALLPHAPDSVRVTTKRGKDLPLALPVTGCTWEAPIRFASRRGECSPVDRVPWIPGETTGRCRRGDGRRRTLSVSDIACQSGRLLEHDQQPGDLSRRAAKSRSCFTTVARRRCPFLSCWNSVSPGNWCCCSFSGPCCCPRRNWCRPPSGNIARSC